MTKRMLWIFAAIAVVAAVVLVFAFRAGNYGGQEFFFRGRYSQFDGLIDQAATRHAVSPALIKAVIWRESRFQPRMEGAHGERGLMQVTEPAAADWAKAEKIETFVPNDLFDPRTNIEAGTWYLAKALKHWSAKDDPVPFALAEFNAGRQRVKRWESAGTGENPGAKELTDAMDFPGTRAYIAAILARYRAFLREEGMPGRFFLDRPGRERE